MVSIKKETFIKGLPHGISADEEDALWGGSQALRPRDHSRWLAHFISAEFAMARLLAGWIPACGLLEWKLHLPRLIWEHMQRARRMRERYDELAAASAPIAPGGALGAFFEGVARADHGASFVTAQLTQVMPALASAYATYISRCDEIFDAPTLHILRLNQPEVERTVAWAGTFLAANPLAPSDPGASAAYSRYVGQYLSALGGLAPSDSGRAVEAPANPVSVPAGPIPAKRTQDPKLRLMNGFPTSKEGNPTKFTLKEIVYHNATEWQVIDPMCEVFYGLTKMPMDFFVDFSRHIWDECRHSMMGFRRLKELGYSLDEFAWCHGNDRLEVLEDYFSGLTLIGEACSFTRKKGSVPLFLRAGDPKSAMLPEVDCADEQLHVGYGHKWVTKIYESVRGSSDTREEIAREHRRRFFKSTLEAQGNSDAKEMLSQLDEKAREELVHSFSGFCGTIEFKMDMTVY
jgi:Protein of unknown function (DUF455)